MRFVSSLLSWAISGLLWVDMLSSQHVIHVAAQASSNRPMSVRLAEARLTKALRQSDIATENISPLSAQSDNTSAPLVISVVVMTVSDVNDAQQTMTASLFINIGWQDDSLAWNSSEHEGVEVIRMPVGAIWTPYIYIENSQDFADVISANAQYVSVRSSGWAQLPIVTEVKTMCPMDLSHFPFDEQVCFIMLHSHDAKLQLNLIPSSTMAISYMAETSEWDLVDVRGEVRAKDTGDRISFPQIVLALQRKTTFYSVCLVLPMVVTSYMNTLVFLLPLESGEKVSYLVTLSVSTSVFSSFFIDMMPRGLDTIPSIMLLFMGVIITSLLFMLVTVLVLRRHHKEQETTSTGEPAGEASSVAVQAEEDFKPSAKAANDSIILVNGWTGGSWSLDQHVRRNNRVAPASSEKGTQPRKTTVRCLGGRVEWAKLLDNISFVVAFAGNTIFLCCVYSVSWSD